MMLISVSYMAICFSCICAKSLYSVTEVIPLEHVESAEPVTSVSREEVHTGRTKRSVSEECEELELCKLHARSGHSLLAAYQLYFVNKENAKLWDHKQHSLSDCEQRYRGCYGTSSRSRQDDAPTKHVQFEDNNSIDDDYVPDDDY